MKGNVCCKICGNNKKNNLYHVKERRVNQGDTFEYLYCSKCGTLQLNEEINDISLYYPDDYYSFCTNAKTRKERILIKKFCLNFILNFPLGMSDGLEEFISEKMKSVMYLHGMKINKDSKILDVGGGDGGWLEKLHQIGFRDLTCIDLFCKKSPYSSIKFFQCDIRDLDNVNQYDLITFHHSFEHMQNPESILNKVKQLLSINGVCLIRIPVCECEVWNRYKVDWYQIDAPRHYYLYTERALRKLCKKCNLQVFKVVYDSEPDQFLVSEYYKNTNLSLKEIQDIIKGKKKSLKKASRKLNKSGRGDQAAFYIKH